MDDDFRCQVAKKKMICKNKNIPCKMEGRKPRKFPFICDKSQNFVRKKKIQKLQNDMTKLYRHYYNTTHKILFT